MSPPLLCAPRAALQLWLPYAVGPWMLLAQLGARPPLSYTFLMIAPDLSFGEHGGLEPSMSLSRSSLLVALAVALTTTACASRRSTPSVSAITPWAPPGPFGGVQDGAAAPARVAALDPAQRAALLREFEQAAGERVFFPLDSYELSREARANLEAQAAWLRGQPQLRILIAGHADERGTREYNLGLGARRAHAARTYLISQGVAAERLDTISYGKERPLDPRSDEQGWARNRNAHSVLTDLLGDY